MDRLSSRRWACAVVGGLVILALMCSVCVATVVWLQLQPGIKRAAATDRIAYVGVDGNIYTVDRQGENALALTTDAKIPTRSGGRFYRFPTWSPDNQWVAFVGTEIRPDQPQTNTVYVVPAAGGERTPLFTSSDSGPFYLYWAPDSRRLAFLASEDDALSLRLVSLDGETRLLDTGAPFYFTWGRDSKTLITHVGGTSPMGRIGRLEIGAAQPEILIDTPAPFLAPAWSPTSDTVLLAAELDDAGPALYLADEQGEPQQVLIRYSGAISFQWSPQGDRIAYVITDRPQPGGLGQFALGRVQVIDHPGDEPRIVSTTDAIAFFWAPDGEKIAYLTLVTGGPQQQGQQMPAGTQLQGEGAQLQWHVVDLRRGEDRVLVRFLPAPGFLTLLPFFDQYAQSLTLWSPDSTALVYSAYRADDPFGVWVISIDGRTPPQRIADGDAPVWSWR